MAAPKHFRTSRWLAFSCLLAIGCIASSVNAQPAQPPQPGQRKIVSWDFTDKRKEPVQQQARKSSYQSPKQKPKDVKPSTPAATYSMVSTPAQVSAPARPVRNSPASVAQLGITVWKLRPMLEGETGEATLVVSDNGSETRWVPVRVNANSKFQHGDLIRLSVETPKAGYVYVIDENLYPDGSRGDPTLIYPWSGMRNGENFLRPGQILDVPSQEDNPSYFRARRDSNQAGELLTFIITSTPLPVVISDPPAEIPRQTFLSWQKFSPTISETFEMDGGVGQKWTRQEQMAATKIKRRQLTRDDPAPQTIYRVVTANRRGYLVSLRLEYAK